MSSSWLTTERPYWWMERPMRGTTTSVRGKAPPAPVDGRLVAEAQLDLERVDHPRQ